jgi:MraZ protein
MLAGAMDVMLDKQGRCVVPEYLREYAGLRKDVIIVGVQSRLEIWDAETWKSYVSKTEEDADTIAEQLGGLSI